MSRRADGLALLGGSFNPPHRTHRRIVAVALQQLPVTEVVVLPAGDHPHKGQQDMAPAEDRLAMCRLCFADLPQVTVDDRELRRSGPSFTVDTLAEFAAEQPGRPLWFLIGADNLALLPTWRDPHRILQLARIATFPRQGHPVDAALLAGLELTTAEQQALLAGSIAMPTDDVSASGLRERLRQGERGLPELVPAVEAHVLAHHLYGT